MTRKAINTVENGLDIPSTYLSLKLAETLDVPLEDIFKLIEQEN